jgi:hypothetical protein
MKPEEREEDKELKEFFNNICRALTAVCMAKTESGKELPLYLSPYDTVFTVLGSEELKEKQREIIQGPEFPKMCNKFVRAVRVMKAGKKQK